MTDPVAAYSKRVESMSRDQIRSTLARHDSLVGTDRWSKLDSLTRDRLLQMGEMLRSKV